MRSLQHESTHVQTLLRPTRTRWALTSARSVKLGFGLALLAAPLAAQGGALRFDGAGDICSVQNTSGDFNLAGNITVEAWVQIDAAQSGGGMVGGQTAGGGTAWLLGGGISQPSNAIFLVSTPSTDSVQAPGEIVAGPTWKHFAGTFDGTEMLFFVNGVQVAQRTHPSPGTASNVLQLIFGRFPNATATLYYAGAMDEVRVWNVTRTPAELLASYNVQLAGNEAGLVGYYKFDEPSGDDILDSSTRGNHGVLGAMLGAGTDDPTRIMSGAPVGPGTLGTAYCMTNPNSTGVPGVLSATGSAAVASNDVTLTADDLPLNAFGFFLTSRTQGFTANPGGSQGNLCLGGSIGRYVGPGQIQNSGGTGSISLVLDLAQTPTPTGLVAVVPGETWNFQGWHRDAVSGSATSNFTNGLSIAFN
jgi:hypothetical protein